MRRVLRWFLRRGLTRSGDSAPIPEPSVPRHSRKHLGRVGGCGWVDEMRRRAGAPHSAHRNPGSDSDALERCAPASCYLVCLSSLMMASRASITSSRDARALGERQLEVEGLRGRPVGEHVVLRAAGLRLGRFVSKLLPGGAAPAGDLLDQRRPFSSGASWRTTCNNNDLEEMSASRQRFRISSGIAMSASDSVTDVRDLPSRLARSSCV